MHEVRQALLALDAMLPGTQPANTGELAGVALTSLLERGDRFSNDVAFCFNPEDLTLLLPYGGPAGVKRRWVSPDVAAARFRAEVALIAETVEKGYHRFDRWGLIEMDRSGDADGRADMSMLGLIQQDRDHWALNRRGKALLDLTTTGCNVCGGLGATSELPSCKVCRGWGVHPR